MKKPKELTCPKCNSPMRTYARNGITIDQCTACHGIFLDRGELEQLISAESSYLGGSPDDVRHASRPAGDKRRRGFLGELFD
ncbi:MAG TPA: zf-TFIIB domain-containing protein [Solirubrobacterales bacterium]|nr:zf-TFIIB domain-containing protein [Solirubrobacterales bacterium]